MGKLAISHVQEVSPRFASHQTRAAGQPGICHLTGSPSIPALCVSSQGFTFPANFPPPPGGCWPWGSTNNIWKPVQCMFWTVGKARCSYVTGLHAWSLCISEGQNNMERETFVLSSYSLTFPRLSVSTKAGHTGLMSKGCSDVQG